MSSPFSNPLSVFSSQVVVPQDSEALVIASTPMPKRSTYRVNYYVRGQVKSAFVCAYTLDEAAQFLGVRDGSASGASVAGPVEVAGVDPAHDVLPILPVTKAESAPPQFTADELIKIRKMLAESK